MSDMKIFKIDGVELDKRTYLPGVVMTATCPKCGGKAERDFEDFEMSYPTTNKQYEISGCCEDCWEDVYLGKITLQLVVEVE